MKKKRKTQLTPSPVPGKISPMKYNVTKSPRSARKEAMFKLANYLKENNLDPEKEWDKDPVHGPVISDLYHIIRIAEDKIRTRVVKLHKPIVHEKIREVRGPVEKYDYPEVDGKPMSSQMKRKYRKKMRALLKANMSVVDAEAKAKEFAYRWDNSEDPDNVIRRRKSPQSGLGATVPIKSKKGRRRYGLLGKEKETK